jgi:DNA helicase-2/ATP-dependent DNA helicase PcrA
MDLSVERILEGLNERQREAVTFGEGPLLVVAGAGTGKTKVITHRIAYLIASKMAAPEEILALTFTDKAAAEMEERVDLLLPYGFANVQISTFHAFGDRLIREYGLEMGLPPEMQVLSQPEQYIFFREHLFEFPLEYYRPLGDPTQFIKEVLALISRAKDEDIAPEEYLAYAERLLKEAEEHPEDETLQTEARRQMELARTYKLYQELLVREGKMDFGDQIALPLRLLRENPVVLKEVQERYRFILVDEFQDTNYAQFQLLQLLAGRHRNITVVGDDDQSIYKFRGAAISNILDFTRTFPDAHTVVLVDNYRSTQAILDAAYRLIQHNNPDRLEVKIGVDKQLRAVNDGPPVVRHLHFDTLTSEADAVASLILERKEAEGYQFRDFAILVRANNDADPFMRALNMKEIPFRFSGSKGLYQRPEIKLLLAFLRVVANFEDSVQLHYLASSEIYRLKMTDLVRCNVLAQRKNLPLYHIFEHLDEFEELKSLSSESRATIQKIVDDVQFYMQLSRERPTGVVLYEFLHRSGYLKALANRRDGDSHFAAQNIAKFFDIVHNFSYIAQVDRVTNFVTHLDLLIEAGDNPATAEADLDEDAVQILTVHRAKGLEFPVVFMVSLVQNKFPHNQRPERIPLPDALVKEPLPSKDFHLQEERRLFYVAMTRAQKELYLTSARDYGGARPRKISQFVREALDKPVADAEYVRTSPEERIARHAPVDVSTHDPFAPIPDSEVITLSFLQIDDYLTCPLKYKYIHILRVPILPHHTVIYGKALHDAVDEYLRRKMRSLPVTLDDLIQIFEASWRSEGFLSREHEEMRLNAGREALARFFEREEADGRLPLYVEKEFSFFWGNNRIIGRWDRIDQAEDGIEIIDYKSSTVHEQEKADRRAKDSDQLALYALAYRELYGEFPVRVKLYFLESGLVGTAAVTEKMIENIKKKIEKAAAGIRQRQYDATPNLMNCHYCAYSNICPEATG